MKKTFLYPICAAALLIHTAGAYSQGGRKNLEYYPSRVAYLTAKHLFDFHTTLVLGAEYRPESQYAARVEAGIPLHWIVSLPWQGLFVAQPDSLRHFYLGLEGRSYITNGFFVGAKLETLPSWYSRINDRLIYRGLQYSYHYAAVSDISTSLMGVAGGRIHAAQGILPIDFYLALGVKHRYIRHTDMLGLASDGGAATLTGKAYKIRKDGASLSIPFSFGVTLGIGWGLTKG